VKARCSSLSKNRGIIKRAALALKTKIAANRSPKIKTHFKPSTNFLYPSVKASCSAVTSLLRTVHIVMEHARYTTEMDQDINRDLDDRNERSECRCFVGSSINSILKTVRIRILLSYLKLAAVCSHFSYLKLVNEKRLSIERWIDGRQWIETVVIDSFRPRDSLVSMNRSTLTTQCLSASGRQARQRNPFCLGHRRSLTDGQAVILVL
jgi:hypothetical protein